MKHLLTGALFAVFSVPVSAATVLEFDGILPVVNDAQAAGPCCGGETITATYSENGYSVDLSFLKEVPEQRDGMLGLQEMGGGAGNRNFSAVISHERGRAFSFDSFVIDEVLTNMSAYYPDVDKSLALVWPALKITGTTVLGHIIEKEFSPWAGVTDTANSLSNGFDIFTTAWSASDDPALGQQVSPGAEFTGLKSLELEFIGFGELAPSLLFGSWACSPENLARVGSDCSAGAEVLAGVRNSSGYVDIESITLTAVPLPAAGLLLAGGLLALGGFGAVRRRS